MSRQVWWSFTYEPLLKIDRELVGWLKSQKPAKCRDNVMRAIRGYWKAIAAIETGIETNKQLRVLGLNCCKELEYHSDYIRSGFDLSPRGTADLNNSPLEKSLKGSPIAKSRDPLSWTFSYQPRESSPDLELIYWLKETQDSTFKVMQALRSYWLPIANASGAQKAHREAAQSGIAIENASSTEEKRLKILALNCCNMLESQADYIREMLFLPSKIEYLSGIAQNSSSRRPEHKVNNINSLVNNNGQIQMPVDFENTDTSLDLDRQRELKKKEKLRDIDDDIMQLN